MIGRPSADRMTRVFQHGSLILPDRSVDAGVVVCSAGRISAVGRAGEIPVPPEAVMVDAGGGFIAPGFVDIHSHGGGGADFMDGTPEAVVAALREHARRGTTTIFPTTTTGLSAGDRPHASRLPRGTGFVGDRPRRAHRRSSLLRALLRRRDDRRAPERTEPAASSRRSTCRSSISTSSALPPVRRSCLAPWTTAARRPVAGTW